MRLIGVIFFIIVFFIKVGVVLGSVMFGWLLVFYGYEVGFVIEDVSSGIVFLFCIFFVLMLVLVVIIMCWYILDI